MSVRIVRSLMTQNCMIMEVALIHRDERHSLVILYQSTIISPQLISLLDHEFADAVLISGELRCDRVADQSGFVCADQLTRNADQLRGSFKLPELYR